MGYRPRSGCPPKRVNSTGPCQSRRYETSKPTGAQGRLRLMEPADFYTGIVVDAYARLKSETFDADLYRRFVSAHGEPALEVGCGDGHPLLDLLAAGLDVEGLDSSVDMLRRCAENVARRKLDVRLHHQRVEDMSLGRKYASIYFAGPTFTLLADEATAGRALRALRDHLTDDGVALIPLWVPSPTPPSDLGRCRSHADGDVEVRYTALSEHTDLATRTRVISSRYERITSSGSEVADGSGSSTGRRPSPSRTPVRRRDSRS